jgi:hypothetical protein
MRVLALGQVSASGGGLDPVRYGRYKYGDLGAVAGFASDLAALALVRLPQLAGTAVTVTAPASRAVPIGADLLADGVVRRLNRVRAERGVDAATRAKLHRFEVPSDDYGTQDAATRRALLAAERISGIPGLFTAQHVLVVDDLWVTGISARVTATAIEQWRPASLTYLVIATVEPDLARERPQIEAGLNHAAVPSLSALAELSRRATVAVNQRMCKFVLRHRPDEIRPWLDTLAPELVWRLHSAALAEGFAIAPAFRDAVAVLTAYVEEHKLDLAAAELGWCPMP